MRSITTPIHPNKALFLHVEIYIYRLFEPELKVVNIYNHKNFKEGFNKRECAKRIFKEGR